MLNQEYPHSEQQRTAVLVGFESAGKSALFRNISGTDTGTEANFRGSTVRTRQARIPKQDMELIDTPGIRVHDDSATTMLALNTLSQSDTVVLVVRGTHAARDLPLLLETLQLQGKNAVLLLTFADKAGEALEQVADHYRRALGISVITVDSRRLTAERKDLLLRAIQLARPMKRKPVLADLNLPAIEEPATTWFEHSIWGRFLSIGALLLSFALPVYIAYILSGSLQPLADSWLLEPIGNWTDHLPEWLYILLMGDYGIFSLGVYSFIWAFPVVLFIGISVAVTEESGLKDRITDSLDGWMRRIGLNGRDLIPVLSGFGCNVVAVFQSRTCSQCTRRSCVSLITFGSACSYQIGASLSIFGSGGRPWLFIPYLGALVIIGAVHTRIWNRGSAEHLQPVIPNRTFLQWPSPRAVSWRVRSVIKQFLTQAMPIFILICLVAGVLQLSGLLNWMTEKFAPLLAPFHLPGAVADGILFSVLRKDGLLVLNQGSGELVASLSAGQLFILVYLASTLTACLVTLWTVSRELGSVFALKLAGRQLLTSIGSALLLSWIIYLI